MKLSRRLQAIADLVDPSADTMIDVGYDHGALLHWAHCQEFSQIIGIERGDHFSGTYNQRFPNDVVDLRCGDGLTSLNKDDLKGFSCIVLSGIGEEQIQRICNESREILTWVEQLVICCSSINLKLRPFLNQLGWFMNRERIIEERGRIYLVSDIRRGVEQNLDKRQCAIGPRLFDDAFNADKRDKYLQFLEERFYSTHG